MAEPEVFVERLDDVAVLMDAVRKHTVVVAHIKREVFGVIDSVLKKEMVASSIRSVSGDYIVVELSYPENTIRVHRNVLYKSAKLSYPDVLMYFMKISTYAEHKVCKSHKDFSKSLLEVCKRGYRFIIFYPSSRLGRGYIVCGGVTGEVLAAIYEEAVTYLGIDAIRFMFFRLPATLFIYVINR